MRKVLLALALTAIKLTASAQHIIPFAAGNLSGYTVKGDNYSTSPVAGFNVGLLADIRLSEMLYLQSGLQYMLVGGKIAFSYFTPVPQTDDMYRFHALQLPVMVTLKAGDEYGEHYFVGLGLYVATNMRGIMESDRLAQVNGQQTVYHIRQDLAFNSPYGPNTADLGFTATAGYHLENGIEFYAFGQRGIIDVMHYPRFPSRSYQFGAGLRYALRVNKQKAAHQGPR